MIKILVAGLLSFGIPAFGYSQWIRGFNLIENDLFKYDASISTEQPKTWAQVAVDHAKRLGANHIILNVRGKMVGGRGSEIIPITPLAQINDELRRMMRLVSYIRSQDMTVGIRPIFFVFGPNGEFPYTEKLEDGKTKIWWHGNIQPTDPDRWFESFRVFLDVYLTLAKAARVEEFTIGAELYSMTVGVEDQWKEHPHGFPGRWLEILRYVRNILPNARLMYDINFTDGSENSSHMTSTGGEFERWRYRIVDLANLTHPEEKKIWLDITTFWKELDAIGIDMYRSLAGNKQKLPSDFSALARQLQRRSDSFATQMNTTLTQIALTIDVDKPVIFKEIGFRSVDRGFIDPFAYAGSGTVNLTHQAAALHAVFESFWVPKWPWFQGLNIWEITLNPQTSGPLDIGFSPVGKPLSEQVIETYFKY